MTDKPQLTPNAPRQSARSTPFGVYSRPNDGGISNIELIAAALSAVWLLGSAIFFLMLPSDQQPDTGGAGLRFLMTMLAIFMPVGRRRWRGCRSNVIIACIERGGIFLNRG